MTLEGMLLYLDELRDSTSKEPPIPVSGFFKLIYIQSTAPGAG